MGRRDVVVIGASAGGIEALRELLGTLPEDLAATVLVVVHMPATVNSALPAILARAATMPVVQAHDGLPLEPGSVVVAVPDRHLLVRDGRVALSRGPRENGHRPAVDTLFRSAAHSAGDRVVSIVLSGAMDDGTAGTIAVRARGGVCLAQDPAEALYPSMPQHAIQVGGAEYVVPVAGMAALLTRLVAEEVAEDVPPAGDLMDMETSLAHFDADALNDDDRPGDPSGFGCPSCHGALFTITEGGMERYRCRVGHAWSPEALASEQSQALEGALWMALRGLEERAALSLRMGQRAEERGHPHSARAFQQRHDEAQQAALVLRGLLQRGELSDEAGPDVARDGAGEA
ncbi:chemotaxis protein CheB [Modestobacter marinus]|uniref:chemotaxis protein CheB n=1 Tax=Modestobacter marinus TaxID=477641 RepID=UPI001C975013|nr:chemotaxis protein CheB [Modestobacter marinus]